MTKLLFKQLVSLTTFKRDDVVNGDYRTTNALKGFLEASFSLIQQNIGFYYHCMTEIQTLFQNTFIFLGRYPYCWRIDSDLETSSLLGVGNNLTQDLFLEMGEWLVKSIGSLNADNQMYKLLQLNGTEMKRCETYAEFYALRFVVFVGISTAQKQPQVAKQYETNGVTFEVFEDELSFDLTIVDCIDKDSDMNNVYVTTEQLELMKKVENPITDMKLRKKSRRQLENEPIKWLPRWLELFDEIKTASLNKNTKSRIDFNILESIVMEYNNENERNEEKSALLRYLNNWC